MNLTRHHDHGPNGSVILLGEGADLSDPQVPDSSQNTGHLSDSLERVPITGQHMTCCAIETLC